MMSWFQTDMVHMIARSAPQATASVSGSWAYTFMDDRWYCTQIQLNWDMFSHL